MYARVYQQTERYQIRPHSMHFRSRGFYPLCFAGKVGEVRWGSGRRTSQAVREREFDTCCHPSLQADVIVRGFQWVNFHWFVKKKLIVTLRTSDYFHLLC